MKCITSVSIAIHFNSCQTEYFKPSRGLCQGDPLSSLIFNLCMAQLSLLISYAASKRKWDDVFYQSTNLRISNMSFADDIVIFGLANLKNVKGMLRMANLFCSAFAKEKKNQLFQIPNHCYR